MDEINFDPDQWFYLTHIVLCDYAVSFSSISDNGREDETDFGFLFWILLGGILYHSSASNGNISFQAIFFTTDANQRYVFYKSMFSSLFFNESFLYTADKEKSCQVFLSNDSYLHFSCNSWSSCG